MKLVLPSERYKKSFLEYAQELRKEDSSPRPKDADVDATNFDVFMKHLSDNAIGVDVPEGYVPSTNFWLIDGNEVVGRASIRHELNEDLKTYGGHIGYIIRPSKRKMGYGTAILKLALEKAQSLGISSVLVTCNRGNEGSLKIIEKNGGIFESEVPQTDAAAKLRYWIKTNQQGQ